MKTTLYFTITLLIFATLVLCLCFVPNSFAGEVKVVYFLPNDREARTDIDTSLDSLIKSAQEFYEENMENHGFGSATFSFETDSNGDAVVHHIDGALSAASYDQDPPQVITEVNQQFDTQNNICFVYLDHRDDLLTGGFGGYHNNGAGGIAVVFALDIATTVHELGHAFGLWHDARPHADRTVESNSVTNGISTEIVRTYRAAEFLSVSQYFGGDGSSSGSTTINMLDPQQSPPDSVKLRFKISDSDGLHQAQLLHSAGVGVIAWETLSSDNQTVEFILTNAVATRVNNNRNVSLFVSDDTGYFTHRHFAVDLTEVLAPPTEISIPDTSLAALIRQNLGLASDAEITQNDMLELISVKHLDDTTIADLTGLEYAANLVIFRLHGKTQISDLSPLSGLPKLSGLSLQSSQISDMSPLANLTSLWQLALNVTNISNITPIQNMTRLTDLNLTFNNITDISALSGLTNLQSLRIFHNNISNLTPLSGLTTLKELDISDNNISDVSPLAGLTNLTHLYLSRNPISDVSSLTGLVNLQELHLLENPIKDRKPLLELLEKNPDVKIYLKPGGEPLPVTLSHFRAEHTDAGVVLKWITESEIDNAGFYIYRSDAKNGEFKVINPTLIQGAGTTSERNTYTWTDSTAKPNVAYYYRIEDISHAGVRKQLATVRMRGLVSASGKLTTRWADLKTQE